MSKYTNKYRIILGFDFFPDEKDFSYEFNVDLHDKFRKNYKLKTYFHDELAILCMKYNFKRDNFNISIHFVDIKFLDYLNDNSHKIVNNYRFISDVFRDEKKYFEFYRNVNFQEMSQIMSYTSRLCYITKIACEILLEMANREGWNSTAISLIERDMIRLINSRQDTEAI
jgi:hypothetical protein